MSYYVEVAVPTENIDNSSRDEDVFCRIDREFHDYDKAEEAVKACLRPGAFYRIVEVDTYSEDGPTERTICTNYVPAG